MDDREIPPEIETRGLRRGALLLAVLVWCGLIFGTSCTVVTSQRFFAWFADHVFTDEESFRKFAVFWGLSWFAIVKGWHAAEYALLFALVRSALDRVATGHPRRNMILALAFCILFALSDEYHQTFVPGRNGTWTDVGIDSLGAGLAALISKLRERRNGGRVMRRMTAGIALVGLAVAGLACSKVGPPPTATVYPFETGDYSFECDGEPKKTIIGTGLMRMSRYPEDIEVQDGKLRVGRRDYGTVAKKDRISVVEGKVAVNGQVRKPIDP